jgi:hypothetical protein
VAFDLGPGLYKVDPMMHEVRAALFDVIEADQTNGGFLLASALGDDHEGFRAVK